MRAAIKIVLNDAEGCVLMQERSDEAPGGLRPWTFPGGGVEPGETPHDAANRELWEASGLTATLVPLGTFSYAGGDGQLVTAHVYGGTYVSAEPGPAPIRFGSGHYMEFATREVARRLPLTDVGKQVLRFLW
jgi:8-oxo-dGTP pyrophosphatase MutT (NUDIX family)